MKTTPQIIMIFVIVFFILFSLISQNTYAITNPYFHQPQSQTIQLILKKEKSTSNYKQLIGIINNIDATYGDLYKNLQNGQKIVIFFDPAHRKLENGYWQGGSATNRLSCTNKPEEFYSIQLSREMYKHLSKNKHISVKTTKDFIEVLKGQSDSYKNIPFSTTIQLAKKEEAFIIISEHLNNVSVLYKADGRVNIPGLHITRDYYGRKILKYVKGSYSGFLTLYNELDASGFSKNYALKLKENLEAKGISSNNWGFGAVADDRFSYFVDFPVSVIYESGFISNPEEEKKLTNPQYIQKIVDAQYNALIENFKDNFAIDISGTSPKKTGDSQYKNNFHRIELLKLSRIAVFYTKIGNSKKTLSTIETMEKKYAKTGYGNYLKYYHEIKKKVIASEKYYNIGLKYKKQKKYRKARSFFIKAKKSIKFDPIYMAYNKKYSTELEQRKSRGYKTYTPNYSAKRKNTISIYVKKASLFTEIVLPIEENQKIEEALSLALSPDPKTLKKLTESFKSAMVINYKKVRVYSKKRKRKIISYKKITNKINFTRGIYIVKLNKKLKVVDAKRVSSVHLSPWKFQNQQYLKNSYFAAREIEKAL